MFGKVQFRQIMLIIKLLYFFHLTNCCENPKQELRLEDEPLKRGRTQRLIWLDRKRIFNFPPDTSISVTPMLAFPLFKESSDWVAFENIQIQWTFFILFEGLGWTSVKNAWPIDLSMIFPNVTNDAASSRRHGEYRICHPSKAKHKMVGGDHPECKENWELPVMSFPVKTPGGERATVIPKIEAILNSFGVNGRACLQRAVCEIHEVPLKNGFGLLGEFLTLMFSISHSIYARSHLQGYLKAEEAGKLGDCNKFNRMCPHSLFTSKQHI